MASIYAKKVLLIEDEETLANILIQKLVLEGFEAFHAKDGIVGLREIPHIHPDIILLDIMMPGKDGYQVLEELRASPDASIKNIPVIIVSNSGQPVEIDRALQYGIKDYFVKATFNPNDVIAKVKKHLALDQGETPNLKMLSKKKIIIVEDDKFLRDLEVQKLEKEHIEVLAAIDGEQGLALIERELPDVVLLDILLPGIDGFEVLTRMKQNPQLDKIVVIMLSNFEEKFLEYYYFP
jgi:DNA-binding response OmpR family regulator